MSNNSNQSLPINLQQVETLLAPIWQSLQRHRVTLALCGALALEGYSQDEATNLICAICRAAGDEEEKSRLRVVASTFKRLQQDQSVMEIGSLWNEKLLDDETIKRLTKLISKKA